MSQRNREARKAAKLAGDTTYLSGIPCLQGHVGPRRTASGSCVACQREKMKRKYDTLAAPARAARAVAIALRHRRLADVRAGYVSTEPKACSKCHETKSAGDFHRDRFQTTGLSTDCRACAAVGFQRWTTGPGYAVRLAKGLLERRALRLTDPKLRWARAAKNGAVMRAKRNGYECTITVDWLYVNAPAVCPLLGIRLCFDNTHSASDSAAVDRKDNTLGYTSENCWVVSMLANRIKSNATIAQLEVFSANLRLLVDKGMLSAVYKKADDVREPVAPRTIVNPYAA